MPLFPASFVVRACRARRQGVLRCGVTLIETLIAITVAAMASSALLLAVQASLSTSLDSVDRTLAEGIAQQLVDEMAQKSALAPGDTVGPILDRYGKPLGTGDDAGSLRPVNFRLSNDYFSRWRKRVSIYYVDSVTLQRLASGTSYYRCMEVTIEQQDATGAFVPLATKRRVIYAS